MIDKIFWSFWLIVFSIVIIIHLVYSITTPDYSKLFCIGYFVVLGVIGGVTQFVNGLHISTKYGLSDGLFAFVAYLIIGLVVSIFV